MYDCDSWRQSCKESFYEETDEETDIARRNPPQLECIGTHERDRWRRGFLHEQPKGDMQLSDKSFLPRSIKSIGDNRWLWNYTTYISIWWPC